jgi:hypothetical protein
MTVRISVPDLPLDLRGESGWGRVGWEDTGCFVFDGDDAVREFALRDDEPVVNGEQVSAKALSGLGSGPVSGYGVGHRDTGVCSRRTEVAAAAMSAFVVRSVIV